jgi:hypothetical protein
VEIRLVCPNSDSYGVILRSVVERSPGLVRSQVRSGPARLCRVRSSVGSALSHRRHRTRRWSAFGRWEVLNLGRHRGSAPTIGPDPRSPTGGGRFPARVPIWSFGATTTGVSDAPTPQVGLKVPCVQAGTTAGSSHTSEMSPGRGAAGNRPQPTNKPSLRWEISTTRSKVDIPSLAVVSLVTVSANGGWQGRLPRLVVPGLLLRGAWNRCGVGHLAVVGSWGRTATPWVA